MRGKKIDNEFLSDFISNCVENNKCTPKEIIEEANSQISFIDQKIKEVEELKIKRSKLLGVVISFEKPNKTSKDVGILQYFDIKNNHVCKFICDNISDNGLEINSIRSTAYTPEDIMFCIKQLLNKNIISRVDGYIIRGPKFEEYCRVIFEQKHT